MYRASQIDDILAEYQREIFVLELVVTIINLDTNVRHVSTQSWLQITFFDSTVDSSHFYIEGLVCECKLSLLH